MSKSASEKEALGQEVLSLCFKSELHSDDIRSIFRCIAEQADTNVRDKWGHTSLMYASRDGHSNIVQELLLRGKADPNLANRNDGWTSLMFASFRNHSRIVSMLLAHGADSTTVTSRWGYSALDIAAKQGHTDVVQLLEAHQRLNRSKLTHQRSAETLRTCDDWLFQLLRCGSCDAIMARKDFPRHCVEDHAGDEDFDWKCSNVEEVKDEHLDCDDQYAATFQLQQDYDDLIQKIAADEDFRQMEEEAKVLLHSWPDHWFQRSKKVPKAPLDPESEEVLQARSHNATLFARSIGSHLIRPLSPLEDD